MVQPIEYDESQHYQRPKTKGPGCLQVVFILGAITACGAMFNAGRLYQDVSDALNEKDANVKNVPTPKQTPPVITVTPTPSLSPVPDASVTPPPAVQPSPAVSPEQTAPPGYTPAPELTGNIDVDKASFFTEEETVLLRALLYRKQNPELNAGGFTVEFEAGNYIESLKSRKIHDYHNRRYTTQVAEAALDMLEASPMNAQSYQNYARQCAQRVPPRTQDYLAGAVRAFRDSTLEDKGTRREAEKILAEYIDQALDGLRPKAQQEASQSGKPLYNWDEIYTGRRAQFEIGVQYLLQRQLQDRQPQR